MKKVYMSPAVSVVECVPATMVATSPLKVENKEQWTEDNSGFEGEATGASRGSWGNIWNEM